MEPKLSSLLIWSPYPTVSTGVSSRLTLLSCSSKVWAFSRTPASVWDSAAESKLMLKSESASVLLPTPVSLMLRMLKVNPFWTLLLFWSGRLSKPTWPPIFSGGEHTVAVGAGQPCHPLRRRLHF
jgi:hypothetical protein